MFRIKSLGAERVQAIQSTNEWEDDCPVSISRLVEVEFLHFDFLGKEQQGSMIVLDQLGESVLSIFQELYALKFPIHSAIPIDHFSGDDVESMNVNNSSAFNCRRIMNTDRWSSHAYGAAIDINPIQNPYVLIDDQNDSAKIYPHGGSQYLNRGVIEKGMVESTVSVFEKQGFSEWGGAWKSPLDYHHFQMPWDEINSWDLKD